MGFISGLSYVLGMSVPLEDLNDGPVTGQLAYFVDQGITGTSVSTRPFWTMARDAVSETLCRAPDSAVGNILYVGAAFHSDVDGLPAIARVVSHFPELEGAPLFEVATGGCSASGIALKLADALTASTTGSTVLVIIGDECTLPTRFVGPNLGVLGDAVVAFVVSRDMPAEGWRIYGGHSWANVRATTQSAGERLRAEIAALRRLTRDACGESGISTSDIDYMTCNNLCRSSREFLRFSACSNRVPLLEEPIPGVGHCFGADILISLALARCEDRCAPGDKFLAVFSGFGIKMAAWTTMVLEQI